MEFGLVASLTHPWHDPIMSRPPTPFGRRRSTIRRLTTLGVALLCAVAAAGCSPITGPRERVLTLEVPEQTVSCYGMFETQCLQVREPSGAARWIFYDEIEGFTYEPGFRYVLSVVEREIPIPLADGPSVAYRLLRIISKTPAP
jgi:hypothetical protein